MSKIKKLTIYPYHIRADKDPQDLFQPDIPAIMQGHIQRLQNTKKAERQWPYQSNVSGEYVQLLEIKERRGCYLFGFARLSTHEGPAKGNKRGNLTSFDLGPDEGFAHLSAALYDPQTGAFIAEQSKTALSAETMLECIQMVQSALYTNPLYLEAVLQKNVLDQLREGMIVSRLDFKFKPSGMTDADFDNNVALKTAAGFVNADEQNGSVQIVLSSPGKECKKGVGTMGNLLLKGACMLLRKYGEHAPISRCEVKIKEEEDQKLQTLDLLKAREKMNITVSVDVNRIVSYTSRYNAIEQAYNTWKQQYYSKITAK